MRGRTFAFYTQSVHQHLLGQDRHADSVSGDNTSYRGQLNYNGDRYGLAVRRLSVGDHFIPEVGFARRDDFLRTRDSCGSVPGRSGNQERQEFAYEGTANYFENGGGRLESRELRGEFRIEFQNSDSVAISYADQYGQFLSSPFRSRRASRCRGRDYFGTAVDRSPSGQQRKVSGNAVREQGPFYSGDRTAYGVSSGRLKVNAHRLHRPASR